jgi:hypothetical protein
MARSPQRVLAFVAMLIVAAATGLAVLLGWALVAAWGSDETSAQSWLFLATALAALTFTLVVVFGLGAGSRALTVYGVVAQGGLAAWLVFLHLTTGWAEDHTGDILLALLCYGVAAFLTLSAVLMPADDGTTDGARLQP